MKYCKNCGKQLPDNARFCIDCGTQIKEASSKRRVEQAGTIYKCPNCGEVPESMTAGMTLGSAIGQNLAGTVNGISGAPVLPPIPESKYYVAVNGQPTGPYAVAALREMMLNGQLTRLSLVWKDGMAGWSAVENVGDLKPILGAVIPPIPTV